MRDLLRRMQPTLFADIVAVGTLYRPGPMGMNAHNDYADRKNNKEKVTPIHPQLEEPLREILGDTYGLIVYQEQIMLIGHEVAGYSMGRADVLRRAMGKKKKEVLDQEYEGFHAGMRSSERIPGGFSDDAVKALWDTILPFAGYAFNKSHAAAYGLISYWTAFLKANYTPEYMAALLTSVADNKDKRTSRRSTSRSAAASASRCCSQTSTSRPCGSPPSGTTSASAWARSATSVPTSSSRS
jgi:DNA polymerase-3 subunit alpha